MKAKAISKARTLSGAPTVTFEFTDRSILNENMLDGREIDLTIRAFRKKRSLNANAYMWALIGQMSAELKVSMDEIYHRMLCDYGTFEREGGCVQYVTIRADATLKGWLYIHTKPIRTVELEGKKFTHYALMKGSSEYDTREMSVLLDGVIFEAKELGIEVMTEEELAKLNGYDHQRR